MQTKIFIERVPVQQLESEIEMTAVTAVTGQTNKYK